MLLNPYRFGAVTPPDPGSGDPYWAYVVSLIQGMTDIVDVKGNTIVNANGNIATSGGKIQLLGTNGTDALYVDDDGVPGAYSWGYGAFCLEGFVSSHASGYSPMWDTTGGNGSALGGLLFELSAPRNAYALGGTGGYVDLQYPFPLDGTEHHLCIMRDSAGYWALGYDGEIIDADYAGSLNLDSVVNEMCIGNYGHTYPVPQTGASIRGHRVTKGHNRYPITLGATYTVPSLPLPESA